jgi:hypothetical protein
MWKRLGLAVSLLTETTVNSIFGPPDELGRRHREDVYRLMAIVAVTILIVWVALSLLGCNGTVQRQALVSATIPPIPTRTPTPSGPTPTPKPSGPPCTAYCLSATACYPADMVGNVCAVGESCVPDCGVVPPTPTVGPGTPTPGPTPMSVGSIQFIPTVGHPELWGTQETVSFGVQWRADMSNGGRFGWNCTDSNLGGNGCIKLSPSNPFIIYGWSMVTSVKVLNSQSLFRLWWSADGKNADAFQLGVSLMPAKIAEIPDSMVVYSPPGQATYLLGGYLWVGGDAYLSPTTPPNDTHEVQVTLNVLGPAHFTQQFPLGVTKALPLMRLGVKP